MGQQVLVQQSVLGHSHLQASVLIFLSSVNGDSITVLCLHIHTHIIYYKVALKKSLHVYIYIQT